jgi:hypothetical protein
LLGGIDILLSNRLINGMYYLPCFALLVILVATTKIHFEEQALVASTKQSSQADKSGRLARLAGMPACFVLCPLLGFAPKIS